MTEPHDLTTRPVHLGLGATVVPQPAFDGTLDWYGAYGQRNEADGYEGRLVSWHTFTEPWDSWEMHPNGAELVVCVSGTITVTQELDGDTATVSLTPGQAAINAPGVWHTADIDGEASAMFITAGVGTEIRPR